MLCPGFVQVSQYHILGDKITDLTGKELKFVYFNIAKVIIITLYIQYPMHLIIIYKLILDMVPLG